MCNITIMTKLNSSGKNIKCEGLVCCKCGFRYICNAIYLMNIKHGNSIIFPSNPTFLWNDMERSVNGIQSFNLKSAILWKIWNSIFKMNAEWWLYYYYRIEFDKNHSSSNMNGFCSSATKLSETSLHFEDFHYR